MLPSGAMSRLYIANAVRGDSGNYTCGKFCIKSRELKQKKNNKFFSWKKDEKWASFLILGYFNLNFLCIFFYFANLWSQEFLISILIHKLHWMKCFLSPFFFSLFIIQFKNITSCIFVMMMEWTQNLLLKY